MTSPDKNPSLEFDVAQFSNEAIEQMKLGVAVDSAYIRGARKRNSQLVEQMRLKDERIRELENNFERVAEHKSALSEQMLDKQLEIDRHKELLRKQCNHSQDLEAKLQEAEAMIGRMENTLNIVWKQANGSFAGILAYECLEELAEWRKKMGSRPPQNEAAMVGIDHGNGD